MNRQPLHCVRVVAGDVRAARCGLDAFVAAHAEIAVRASCTVVGLGIDVVMERDIVVRFASTRDAVDVTWRSSDDGRFLRLSGVLFIEPLDEHFSLLCLRGSYPRSAETRAALADAALGYRLAHGAADALFDALTGAGGRAVAA